MEEDHRQVIHYTAVDPPLCVRNGQSPSISRWYAKANCWVLSFHTGEARPPAPATNDSIPGSASRISVDTARTSAAGETPCYQRCHQLPGDAHGVLTSRILSLKALESQDHWSWPRPLAPAGPRTQEDREPRVRHSGRASTDSKFGKKRQGLPMEPWIPSPGGSGSRPLWFLTTASLAGAGDEAIAAGREKPNIPSPIKNACRNVVTIPPCEISVTAILYQLNLRANIRVSPLDVVESNSLKQVYPCWIYALRETARDNVNQTGFWGKVFVRDWGIRALVTSILDMVKPEDQEPPNGSVLPEPWA